MNFPPAALHKDALVAIKASTYSSRQCGRSDQRAGLVVARAAQTNGDRRAIPDSCVPRPCV